MREISLNTLVQDKDAIEAGKRTSNQPFQSKIEIPIAFLDEQEGQVDSSGLDFDIQQTQAYKVQQNLMDSTCSILYF